MHLVLKIEENSQTIKKVYKMKSEQQYIPPVNYFRLFFSIHLKKYVYLWKIIYIYISHIYFIYINIYFIYITYIYIFFVFTKLGSIMCIDLHLAQFNFNKKQLKTFLLQKCQNHIEQTVHITALLFYSLLRISIVVVCSRPDSPVRLYPYKNSQLFVY